MRFSGIWGVPLALAILASGGAPDPARWTDERLAARVLGVAFVGTEVTPEVRRWVGERGVGAIVLYRTNTEAPEAVPQLTANIAALAPAPALAPIIAIDQEGGSVIRYEPAMLPSAMAIAATGSLDLAREAGRFVGCMLRRAGITMNLAPTLDLSTPRDASGLGSRALSSSPALAGEVAAAYIAGLHDAGLLAVAKHFPGQGHASGDPHTERPVVERQPDEIEREDLAPFRRAIEAGVDGIMTAHVVYPNWPGSGGEPAIFSAPLITDLLRGALGFDGLVITDAVGMVGTGERDPQRAAVRALQAGADLILTSSPFHAERAYNGIVAALREKRLARERVIAAARRVLDAPRRHTLAGCDCAASPDFPEQLARAAVTEIRSARTQPSFSDAVFAGPRGALADAFPLARRIEIPVRPSPAQIEETTRKIAATEGPLVAAIQNHWQAAVIEGVQRLQPDRPLRLVVLGSPYDALRIRPGGFVFAYSFLRTGQLAALEVLEGKRCAPGRLPVDLGGIAQLGEGDSDCLSSEARESR